VKTVLSMVVLIVIIFLGVIPSARAHIEVNVSEAQIMVENNPQLIVVDVREESEYCGSLGHIPGALNYPWTSGVLEARWSELPLNGEILVVCYSGGRSHNAAVFLDEKNFTDIYDMVGGMRYYAGTTVDCCYADEDCSDGLYCTGVENCLDLNCQPGPGTPCVSPEWCDEDQDSCIVCPGDYDCDGIIDDDDTCPEYPDPLGEDTLPPIVGNGCGDACDCEGNFNAHEDDDVDGSDAAVFKADFGRGGYNNPCPACTAVDPWCGY